MAPSPATSSPRPDSVIVFMGWKHFSAQEPDLLAFLKSISAHLPLILVYTALEGGAQEPIRAETPECGAVVLVGSARHDSVETLARIAEALRMCGSNHPVALLQEPSYRHLFSKIYAVAKGILVTSSWDEGIEREPEKSRQPLLSELHTVTERQAHFALYDEREEPMSAAFQEQMAFFGVMETLQVAGADPGGFFNAMAQDCAKESRLFKHRLDILALEDAGSGGGRRDEGLLAALIATSKHRIRPVLSGGLPASSEDDRPLDFNLFDAVLLHWEPNEQGRPRLETEVENALRRFAGFKLLLIESASSAETLDKEWVKSAGIHLLLVAGRDDREFTMPSAAFEDICAVAGLRSDGGSTRCFDEMMNMWVTGCPSFELHHCLGVLPHDVAVPELAGSISPDRLKSAGFENLKGKRALAAKAREDELRRLREKCLTLKSIIRRRDRISQTLEGLAKHAEEALSLRGSRGSSSGNGSRGVFTRLARLMNRGKGKS